MTSRFSNGQTLFDVCAEVVRRPKVCQVCYGDGFETEAKDSDSEMKVPCPACGAENIYSGELILQKLERFNDLRWQPPKQTGEQRKRIGQNRTLNANGEWAAKALPLFRNGELGKSGDEITSDDLRDLMPEPPTPAIVGAVFTTARKAGLIKRTGRSVPSFRPEANGRLIQEWRMTNA